jgi:hypothetical protein
LSETHPDLEGFTAFLELLNKESDRGAALISVAMLDDLLERTILAFLVQGAENDKLLSGFNAPLIFSPMRCRLFAGVDFRGSIQGIHQTFEDQKVKDICANLSYAAKGPPEAPVNTKGQYVTAAVGLILGLTNRPHYVAQKRLKYGDWKA